MTVAPSSALYYPTIDVPDDKWLRNACLFWDSINTIVPESIKTPYSSRLANELADEGILSPIRVASGMDEVESLTDDVLEFLTSPESISTIVWDPWENPDNKSQLSYLMLNGNKLPTMIRDQFMNSEDREGWLRVHPDFRNFYMTLLATRLANRFGLGLVTNSKAADELALAVRKGPYLAKARGRRPFDASGPRRKLPPELASGMLVDLAIGNISIEKDVTAKELLRFRSAHAEERALFRNEVNNLASVISPDLSVEAMRRSIHDLYSGRVKPALKNLRKSMAAQLWATALNGLLKVSFFSVAPTSAAIFAGVPVPIALLAATGVSVTASAITAYDQHRRAVENPYSYLTAAEKFYRRARRARTPR